MQSDIRPDIDVSLKTKNTLSVDALAQYCVRVDSDDTLRQAIAWAATQGLPIIVLGEGSNVLLHKHLPGLVLLMENRGIDTIEDDGRYVTLSVAAGENWHDFVDWCVARGFYGLENLALIPGTVGAAPVQNIGAYGVEVADWIVSVQVCHTVTGDTQTLSPEDCQFAYRDSLFKATDSSPLIITSVVFRLDRQAAPDVSYPSLQAEIGDAQPTPVDVFTAVQAIRRRRLPNPATVPNVGSFFKNPEVDEQLAQRLSLRWPAMPQHPTESGRVKLSAAWMIDQLNWRGKSHAGAAVDNNHALILINKGASEVTSFLEIAAMITDSVDAYFSVRLEIEPRILGRA